MVFCLIFADASRSLKAERNSNQRAHAAMLSHVNEQKDESEKNLRETNLKLTSLQQHFKLLKSEHDDAMEACAKAKAKHLDEINALQRKLQGMETYGGQTVKEKDKLIELLKVSNHLLTFCCHFENDMIFFILSGKEHPIAQRQSHTGESGEREEYRHARIAIGNRPTSASNRTIQRAYRMATIDDR